MKCRTCIALAWAAGCLFAHGAPNFLMILTDDQGWSQLTENLDPRVPEAATDYLETPNMDRLGRAGVRFTSGYAPAPLCTPTRRSIQCGTSAARSGTEFKSPWVPGAHLTIPKALKQSDPSYVCAHFGKWGESMVSTPEECGYDFSDGETGNVDGGAGKWGKQQEFHVVDDPKRTGSITGRAEQFMQTQAGAEKPFYLQVSYYAQHLRVELGQQTLKRFEAKGGPDRAYTAGWAGMLSELDTGVGRLLDKLDALGIADNTYVVFMADNGGTAKAPAADESLPSANYPLTGAKHTLFEGGVRVPFMMCGPGIEAGSICRVPVVGYDLLPTFHELAGGTAVLPPEIDGASIRPLLADPVGGTVARRRNALYFHRPGKGVSAMRQGDHKLMLHWAAPGTVGSRALYNLGANPREEGFDLSANQPEKTAAMEAVMMEYLRSVNAEGIAPEGGADEGVISVSFHTSGGKHAINPKKFRGVAADPHWVNLMVGASGSTYSSLRGTTLDITLSHEAGSNGSNGDWNGWPHSQGLRADTRQPVEVSLAGIPYEKYCIVAYPGGFKNGYAAAVGLGSVTKYVDFFHNTITKKRPVLVESTDTDISDGCNPGSYVVFGSPDNPLTGSRQLLKLVRLGGSPVLGGFQIVKVESTKKTLTVFPVPAGMPESDDYQVQVDGREVFCHGTWRADNATPTSDVNGRPVSPLSFATFDFEGAVSVRLVLREGLLGDGTALRIYPSRLGIRPRMRGHVVEFNLDAPGQVTVDPRGDGLNALHLFSNLPETDIPDPNDPNVIYYGPGIHRIEDIRLTSGQTLYLAGGAVLMPQPERVERGDESSYGLVYQTMKGGIEARGDGITIRGRGIISGVRAFENLKRFLPVRAKQSTNFTLRDIIVMDPSRWSTCFGGCSNVLVDNLKILGYFTNSDGTVVSESRDVVVRNSFVHNSDDGFQVKAWHPARNVRYENCQIWSDNAGPMGFPQEGQGDITDIVWTNITVLHYTAPKRPGYESRGIFTIHPIGGGTTSRVRFEDIVIENSTGGRPVFHISNAKLDWSGQPYEADQPFCTISNLVFRNITANNVENEKAFFHDASGSNLITDIEVSNVCINGTRYDRFEDLPFSTGHAVSGNFGVKATKDQINIRKFIGLVEDPDWEEMSLGADGAGPTTESWQDIDGSTLDVSATYSQRASARLEWNGMPQRGGMAAGESSAAATLTLSDIPYRQYYLIVYVSGYRGSKGSLTAGIATVPWHCSSEIEGRLVQGTDADPVGSYILFGSKASPLTGASQLVTMTPLSGVPFVGGFQVVEVKP